MPVIVQKQDIKYFEPVLGARPRNGVVWAETYDMLQRHWPESRTRQHHPYLLMAAARLVKRRLSDTVPNRQSFANSVDYYNAMMPLVMAQHCLDHTPSWRYVRPLMIRILLRGWPRYPLP